MQVGYKSTLHAYKPFKRRRWVKSLSLSKKFVAEKKKFVAEK